MDAPTTLDGRLVTLDGLVTLDAMPQLDNTLLPPDAVTAYDLPPTDTIYTPDTLPYHVNEPFNTGPGVVAAQRGNWTVSGGMLRQLSENENDNYATAPVPVDDYTVESEITIYKLKNLMNISEGAGVSARVQPPSRPGVVPGQYICLISPDGNVLGLLRAYGNTATVPALSTTSVQIQLNVPYRVRLTVKGATLTCELPDLGKQVTATDSTFSSGPAGLVTMYASAAFDYLLVW
jgi:hypothetical protein